METFEIQLKTLCFQTEGSVVDGLIAIIKQNRGKIGLEFKDDESPEQITNKIIDLVEKNKRDISKKNQNLILLNVVKKIISDEETKLEYSNDNSGKNILEKASEFGFHEVIASLKRKGADINYCNSSGDSLLVIAVKNEHPETVKTLLALEAKVGNAISFAKTPDLVEPFLLAPQQEINDDYRKALGVYITQRTKPDAIADMAIRSKFGKAIGKTFHNMSEIALDVLEYNFNQFKEEEKKDSTTTSETDLTSGKQQALKIISELLGSSSEKKDKKDTKESKTEQKRNKFLSEEQRFKFISEQFRKPDFIEQLRSISSSVTQNQLKEMGYINNILNAFEQTYKQDKISKDDLRKASIALNPHRYLAETDFEALEEKEKQLEYKNIINDLVTLKRIDQDIIYQMVATKNTELLQSLLKNPDVDFSNIPIAAIIIESNDPDYRQKALRILINANLNIDLSKPNDQKKSPIELALENNDSQIIRILTEEYPDLFFPAKELPFESQLNQAIQDYNAKAVKQLLSNILKTEKKEKERKIEKKPETESAPEEKEQKENINLMLFDMVEAISAINLELIGKQHDKKQTDADPKKIQESELDLIEKKLLLYKTIKKLSDDKKIDPSSTDSQGFTLIQKCIEYNLFYLFKTILPVCSTDQLNYRSGTILFGGTSKQKLGADHIASKKTTLTLAVELGTNSQDPDQIENSRLMVELLLQKKVDLDQSPLAATLCPSDAGYRRKDYDLAVLFLKHPQQKVDDEYIAALKDLLENKDQVERQLKNGSLNQIYKKLELVATKNTELEDLMAKLQIKILEKEKDETKNSKTSVKPSSAPTTKSAERFETHGKLGQST